MKKATNLIVGIVLFVVSMLLYSPDTSPLRPTSEALIGSILSLILFVIAIVVIISAFSKS